MQSFFFFFTVLVWVVFSLTFKVVLAQIVHIPKAHTLTLLNTDNLILNEKLTATYHYDLIRFIDKNKIILNLSVIQKALYL